MICNEDETLVEGNHLTLNSENIEGKRKMEDEEITIVNCLYRDLRKLSVKDLRRLVPELRIRCFFKEEEIAGKRKLRRLWDTRPPDWPHNVPFLDPNNPSKDAIKKPTKNELVPMFEYLRKLFMHKVENGDIVLPQRPTLQHHDEDSDEDREPLKFIYHENNNNNKNNKQNKNYNNNNSNNNRSDHNISNMTDVNGYKKSPNHNNTNSCSDNSYHNNTSYYPNNRYVNDSNIQQHAPPIYNNKNNSYFHNNYTNSNNNNSNNDNNNNSSSNNNIKNNNLNNNNISNVNDNNLNSCINSYFNFKKEPSLDDTPQNSALYSSSDNILQNSRRLPNSYSCSSINSNVNYYNNNDNINQYYNNNNNNSYTYTKKVKNYINSYNNNCYNDNYSSIKVERAYSPPSHPLTPPSTTPPTIIVNLMHRITSKVRQVGMLHNYKQQHKQQMDQLFSNINELYNDTMRLSQLASNLAFVDVGHQMEAMLDSLLICGDMQPDLFEPSCVELNRKCLIELNRDSQ